MGFSRFSDNTASRGGGRGLVPSVSSVTQPSTPMWLTISRDTDSRPVQALSGGVSIIFYIQLFLEARSASLGSNGWIRDDSNYIM